MAEEIFPISSVQIIEKCILESFPPPLHDLIIGSHVKQPHYKLAQKSMFPHAKLFHEKKMPPYFSRRRFYALSYLFLFLKVSYITFVVQTMVFQTKLPSHCVFKVMQYGYEIFQTVLSLNYKII